MCVRAFIYACMYPYFYFINTCIAATKCSFKVGTTGSLELTGNSHRNAAGMNSACAAGALIRTLGPGACARGVSVCRDDLHPACGVRVAVDPTYSRWHHIFPVGALRCDLYCSSATVVRAIQHTGERNMFIFTCC